MVIRAKAVPKDIIPYTKTSCCLSSTLAARQEGIGRVGKQADAHARISKLTYERAERVCIAYKLIYTRVYTHVYTLLNCQHVLYYYTLTNQWRTSGTPLATAGLC